jgi:hypothetical protein
MCGLSWSPLKESCQLSTISYRLSLLRELFAESCSPKAES